MGTCVKCPFAFDVVALYALTNFTGELRFKIICFVGCMEYSCEESCGALWCSWGQWGEELVWVWRPLGGFAGQGAARGTPDKVSPSDGGSAVELQLCNFQWNFTYSQSRMRLSCWAWALLPHCFVLAAFKEQRGHSECGFKLFHECDCVMGSLVLLPSGGGNLPERLWLNCPALIQMLMLVFVFDKFKNQWVFLKWIFLCLA